MIRTTRYVRTVRRLALSLLPLAVTVPAWSQSAPPEGQRTVDFYVQHPSIRARVDRACLNDPGHLRDSPDCWNAHRANLEDAARKAHVADENASDPRTAAYWTARPNERRFKLSYCRHMTPDAAARALCLPAEQSFVAEQSTASTR